MSGHGFKLAPVVADIVASDLLDQPHPEFDIEFFSLSRYTQDRSIGSEHPYSVGTLG